MSYSFNDAPIGPFTVTKIFTGSQLDAFNATPLQLVAAPGAGFVIYPLRVSSMFIQTGSNLYAADQGIECQWGASAIPNPMDTNGINPNSTSAGNPIIASWDFWKLSAATVAAGDNQPLTIKANFDWNTVGEPVTSHASTPGTGYSPGDVTTPGGDNWQIHVDTVNGGGGILTYHIVHAQLPGLGFPVGQTLNCSDAGGGDAVITIDSIQAGTNGKFVVTMEYLILPTT